MIFLLQLVTTLLLFSSKAMLHKCFLYRFSVKFPQKSLKIR